MKIDNEPRLDFDDVLLVPQRSKTASRKDVDVARRFKFINSDREWSGVPLVAANMDTTGTLSMATALQKENCVTCLHKHQSFDSIFNYFNNEGLSISNTWISIGINEQRWLEFEEFLYRNPNFKPNLCIDVANGYTDDFVSFCRKVRQSCSTIRNGHYSPIIMAGNVATPEMTTELILHGHVDIVKVGIGPGSACTTRLKAGVGVPQLSAIIDCSHAAHGLRNGEGRLGLICADGGCRTPSDVVKAYSAGADFVMLGGMLAGTEECNGEWQYNLIEECDNQGNLIIVKENKISLQFYGMSSETAQKKHHGGMSDYKSSEGRVKTIPYKGYASETIKDILGGVRSACAYSGVDRLKDLNKAAKFTRVNRTHFDQTL